MEKLYPILAQMKVCLDELEAIMIEEVSQLDRTKINPVLLQVLSDNKSQLLSTIQHYDNMRKQREQTLNIAAPYSVESKLSARWQQVSEAVARTRVLNEQVATMLQQHVKKNQTMQKVVEQAGGGHTLYGPAGEASRPATGHRYDFSI